MTIRAGFAPRQALAIVAEHTPGRTRAAFVAVEERCRSGQRFADALAGLVDELGLLTASFADGLAAAERDGAPLGSLLERLGREAHEARRQAAQRRARQLPVRLTLPVTLCTLPAFVLLAIAPMLIGAISSLQR